jgi:hypothetical protein
MIKISVKVKDDKYLGMEGVQLNVQTFTTIYCPTVLKTFTR